jgi:hypothetical protein
MAGLTDFLAFRKSLPTAVIKIFFWIGVVGCFFGGIAYAVRDLNSPCSYWLKAVVGVSVAIFGPIVWRIVCEYLIAKRE